MPRKNLEMVKIVAEALGDLRDHVVFVGGSIIELYADHSVPEEVRPTEDVDLVVDIATRKSLAEFEKMLSGRGFFHDFSEGAPMCRWQCNGITVDLMATESGILGFGNQWYQPGFAKKMEKILPGAGETIINLLPLIYYLATKIDAVFGRGLTDLRLSHDFEDIVYLFDNCLSLENDFYRADSKVRKHLSASFSSLTNLNVFKEALACSMPPNAQKDRASTIERLMLKIASNLEK